LLTNTNDNNVCCDIRISHIGYYSQVRPHRHNQGTAPNMVEAKYWESYNSVAKLTWPLVS